MDGRLALLGIALTLAGCATRGEPIGPLFGSLELTDSHVTSAYDLATGRLDIRVDGLVTAEDAERVRVDAWVEPRACPKGPTSTPERAPDATTMLGDVAEASTLAFSHRIVRTATPGSELSLIVETHGGNVIDPIFGACHDVRALPRTDKA